MFVTSNPIIANGRKEKKMKIIFLGVTKKQDDTSEFFKTLDKHSLSCDIDVIDGNITVHNVPRQLRATVINDFRELFDIKSIQTRPDDSQERTDCVNNKINNVSSVTPVSQNSSNFKGRNFFNDALLDLSNTLENSSLSQEKKINYLRLVNSELNLFLNNQKLDVEEGDIVECMLNFSLEGENYGITNFIVLKKFSKKSFLGIRFIGSSTFNSSNTFLGTMDITYVDNTGKIKEETILLYSIQPVSYKRCIKKVGKLVSDNSICEIAKNLYEYMTKTAKEENIVKFMKPALRSYNALANQKSQNDQFQVLFSILHIPERMQLLRASFTIISVTKDITLKNIISFIQQNCVSVATLKESTIEKKLRQEFLEWIDIQGSSILKGYDEISLITLLKVFAKYAKVK